MKSSNLSFVNKKDLLGIQARLHGDISKGEKDPFLFSSVSILAEIMKVYHAIELLETQGVISLHKYLKDMHKQSFTTKVKAVKNLVSDHNFRASLIKTEIMVEKEIEHPKLIELKKIIREEIANNKDLKAIVFNQYRDNAQDVCKKLNTIEGIRAELFVGQTKKGDTGLSQKEQKQILEKFKQGEYNIIVATSIGEEGLDIPKVDLVLFFEPVPSAIRTIQRRGRTGRSDKGRVIVLVAKNTRDEGYRWSAHHKEKRMYSNLKTLKKEMFSIVSKPQEKSLNSFIHNENLKIYVDHREKGSNVIKALLDLDIDLKIESLGSADFILSARVGVEFKTVADFVNSIIDGRLLNQIKDLKNNFERPLIIIEGQEDIYSIRRVHKNAILGMLATISISYGIPIIQTKTYTETATLLYTIAKREADKDPKEFDLHTQKKPLTLKEQQEYIVSSLPGIGPTLSKPLLRKFKTVKNIVNAKAEDLEKIDKIGKIKAENVRNVLDREYE